MSRVENLLVRVRAQNPAAQEEDEEGDMEDDLKAGPSFQHVPWDEIVALCIDHRLKDWRPPECPVSEGEVRSRKRPEGKVGAAVAPTPSCLGNWSWDWWVGRWVKRWVVG